VGTYRFKAEQGDFQPIVREGLRLTVGQALDLSLHFSVAVVETNVTVTGEQPVIEIARTQVAETVTQNEINSLPLNGRNYLDLALLWRERVAGSIWHGIPRATTLPASGSPGLTMEQRHSPVLSLHRERF
jgi:hypothetical protein